MGSNITQGFDVIGYPSCWALSNAISNNWTAFANGKYHANRTSSNQSHFLIFFFFVGVCWQQAGGYDLYTLDSVMDTFGPGSTSFNSRMHLQANLDAMSSVLPIYTQKKYIF